MGCDIHSISQAKVGDSWVTLDFSPFDWRDYGVYSFLAGVRNYSDVAPISEPRGLPDGVPAYGDDDLGDHSYSWLSVDELAQFNYDAPMEDRRVTVKVSDNYWDHGATSEPGGGKMKTYREFLGEHFFIDLAKLQEIGADRIVFGFDS